MPVFSTDPLADNSQQGVFGEARLSGIGAKAIASRQVGGYRKYSFI